MAVKIWRKKNIMGKNVLLPFYEPVATIPTKEKRDLADLLDVKLKVAMEKAQWEYNELRKGFVGSDYKKWKWLGGKLDEVIHKMLAEDLLSEQDKDSHVIWPAIAQYLEGDLKRGFDTKRSGTKKDHYRKCWLLATRPSLEWITSWGGWDAFIDRGEQLALSRKLMPQLNSSFGGISNKLSQKDYQLIAKLLTEQMPSGTRQPKDIDSMADDKIREIVKTVHNHFV